jgi:septal ring factor EnvC (AmiA/AmiB activator)
MEATGPIASTEQQGSFKSPLRLLLRFFHNSRDKWRAKSIQRRAKIKNLEHKVRDLDKSRAAWKDKAQQEATANKALQERLRAVEAERDQLRAQREELESKKNPRPTGA